MYLNIFPQREVGVEIYIYNDRFTTANILTETEIYQLKWVNMRLI